MWIELRCALLLMFRCVEITRKENLKFKINEPLMMGEKFGDVSYRSIDTPICVVTNDARLSRDNSGHERRQKKKVSIETVHRRGLKNCVLFMNF